MRLALLLTATVACLACAVLPVDAHVRILYTDFPIRNALGATLDGQYSVAGPCGGVSSFGARGVTTVTSGAVITVKIAYNGGHQSPDNAFHATSSCGSFTVGSTFDDSVLKTGTGVVLPLTSGATSVPATDSSTAGYSLTFKAPTLSGTTAQTCVISLLDQRSWGGCIDISLVPGGTGASGGSSTTTGVTKSPCTTYCDGMAATCTGVNVQFPAPETDLDCMTTCGGYPRVVDDGSGEYSGSNLECRQHHLEYAAQYNMPDPHCIHASYASNAAGCVDTTGTTAVASPCATYCKAVAANCASSSLYANTNACLSACAAFLETGAGSELTPAKGPNIQCRTAAALAGTCADASATATGECALANPLKIYADTVSAVYQTSDTMCLTAAQRAANTIAGCCCISGTIEVIHIKGQVTATVTSTNLTAVGGEMCANGFVKVASSGKNYTFTSAITSPTLSFSMTQPDVTSTTLTGEFTLASDSMTFQLVDNLFIITNDAPSTRAPRVCSLTATVKSKIDTSSLGSGASSNASAGLISLLIAAVLALLAVRL